MWSRTDSITPLLHDSIPFDYSLAVLTPSYGTNSGVMARKHGKRVTGLFEGFSYLRQVCDLDKMTSVTAMTMKALHCGVWGLPPPRWGTEAIIESVPGWIDRTWP